MMGYTSQVGYKHRDSKAVRGDKFCGLLCDNVNQEDQTENRVKNWVAQLLNEGFLEKGTSASSIQSKASMVSIPPAVESATLVKEELLVLERQSDIFHSTLSEESKVETAQSSMTFTPHFNSKSGVTMWVSTDGRKCFYTTGKP